MRSRNRQRTFVRFIAAALLAVGGLLVLPQPGAAEASLSVYTDSDGNRWLTGCVPDNVAANLVEHGGFTVGGPTTILCVLGYTLVSKPLG